MKSSNIPPNYQRIINDAWLGINVQEDTLYNPLNHVPMEFEDEPHMYYLWLMQQPEYFSFICKEIMGVQLLPVQSLMLKEMWHRRFPMLIASRGFGKLIREDEVIRIKNGWQKIKYLNVGDKVYGSNGKLCNIIGKTDLQTNVNMYRITLRDGRSIDCCEDHMWKVWDKNKNRNKKELIWSELSTKDMVNNYFLIRQDSKSKTNKLCKEYRYALPINDPIIDDEKIEYKIHPYIVGALLGDGCLTTHNISITTADQEIVDKIRKLLPYGYKLRFVPSSDYQYNIVRYIETNVKTPFYMLCKFVGIYGYKSDSKFIPESYKFGSYEQRLELVRGLMDTDGYAKKSAIEYYTISNKLSSDFLEVARSLGLHCKHSIKESWFNGNQYTDCNRIAIYTKLPIFSLSRKLNSYINHPISKQGQSKYEKVFITNIEPIGKGNGYCIEVDSPDKTYITKDYIVTHNSFMLALYTLLRIMLLPERRVVICGAAFRQSKVIFNYMESIWYNSPLMRDFCGQNAGPRHEPDMFRFHIGDSVALALPIGDGGKIRGQRANDIIADEFAAQSKEVFENVIAGFAAVKSSPVESVRDKAGADLAKKLGYSQPQELNARADNQIILSGTAYYDFNHFGEYWKRWRNIIRSKGDPKRLKEVFGDEDVPEDFNWSDYSIIRLPFELIPKGFMDEAMVARSKATIHSGIYMMEFGAVFSNDSNGFFKRSLIESCVLTNDNEITLPSGPVHFSASLRGKQDCKYIYGIDPASEIDNFSIVILEHHEDHRRIVYAWTTNRGEHKDRVKKGLSKETDFYSYCARKIRELMNVFPCARIAMDSQGGGVAVNEALHDLDKIDIDNGEVQIWPVIEPGKSKDTDGEPGLHIIEMINFSSAEWTSEANHGLRKDFEDKICIFPFFDSVSLGLAKIADDHGDRLYDTLEDCLMEIEELKNELSTIVISQTLHGRDRWDTPEIKLPGNKKGRLRKDRYSSLIMANMVSRQMARNPEKYFVTAVGGWAGSAKASGENMGYVGASWLANGLSNIYE